MSHLLYFKSEVEEDVFAAYLWYEEKAVGLGEDFLRLVYAQAAEIARNPLLYQIVETDFRRCLLKRFPFSIYFRIIDEQVIIFGVFHCARNPNFISEEIDKRE